MRVIKFFCLVAFILATLIAAPAVMAAEAPRTPGTATNQAAAESGSPVASEAALNRRFDKNFQDLTPSERIALRADAKKAYEEKRLGQLVVCADPGNMPFSNAKLQGFENKIAEVLGKASGAVVQFYWRPSIERGLTRQTFDTRMCDAMIDIPTGYESLLTTNPIYRTTYVLAYRSDNNPHIKSFDDPKLKTLKLGVFQTSGVREVLMRHGVVDNVSIHTVSHDADVNVKDEPWYQVQQVVEGKLDAAAVWGPFAGWVKAKGEPITIQPVNLWEDTVPLEFDMAIGVRKTDGLLKYILDYALDDHKAEIEAILRSYDVPLVQCSRCVVPGDIPAHGSYTKPPQNTALQEFPAAKEAEKLNTLKAELAAGADPIQELSNALIANDLARVKLLHDHGVNINARDSQGYTPLISAARQRYTDMIKLLLDLGADPNATNADGITPLIESIMRDDGPSIKELLGHGADKELPGPEGFVPLAFAIEEQKYAAAKALIDAGARVNVTSKDQGLTPLMIAAAETTPAEGAVFLPSSIRPIDVAKALVQHGADVNAKNKNGTTALMVAASHDNAPMIGLLLQSGADAEIKNFNGQTALDIANRNGNQEAARAISVLGALSGSPPEPSSNRGAG